MIRLECLDKLSCVLVFIRCLKRCAKNMVRAGAFDECMMFCGCIYLPPLHKWSCDDYRKFDIRGC